VIVGAGLSGLSCAYRLEQLGIAPLVLEAADRPGGAIATLGRNGFLFESGPQFPRFAKAVWQLVRELNLETEFVWGNPKAKRYILRDGKLERAPFSPVGLLSTGLVGRSAKYRILTEVFGSSHPPETEETLAQFVERKFGVEVLENLADPIVSTVFLGDARKMGMLSAFPALVNWEKQHGSLIRGALRSRKGQRDGGSAKEAARKGSRALHVTDALPSLGSFKEGMATLTDGLAAALGEKVRYGARITGVGCAGGGTGESGWRVAVAGGEELEAEHLILAVPAYVAAELLRNAATELAEKLASIEYAPLEVVACGYERGQVAHDLDGFGFMVPRREGLRIISTFWNSSLFPGRAPEGKVLVTSFARVGANAGGEGGASQVHRENAKILGITGEPIEQFVWRDARALPQYNVGHAGMVAEIEKRVAKMRTLNLAGNYLHGRSIGECVENSLRLAESLGGR